MHPSPAGPTFFWFGPNWPCWGVSLVSCFLEGGGLAGRSDNSIKLRTKEIRWDVNNKLPFGLSGNPQGSSSFLQKEKHSKSAHVPIDAYPKTAAHIATCVGHRRLTETCWGLSILAGGLFLQILLVLSDFLIYFIALMTDVWITERLPSVGNAEQLMILRCVRL